MCDRIATKCGTQHRHCTQPRKEVAAKLRKYAFCVAGCGSLSPRNFPPTILPHFHTCSSGGHTWSSPMERQEVLSQRFHTNSQLGSVTGLSLGKGRVRSSVSQKKCAPGG